MSVPGTELAIPASVALLMKFQTPSETTPLALSECKWIAITVATAAWRTRFWKATVETDWNMMQTQKSFISTICPEPEGANRIEKVYL